jgi:hypothetical protein
MSNPSTDPRDDLPAISALRDFPSPADGRASTTPRIAEYNNAKIRNLCLLLSIAVVFNHSITTGDLRHWQGESIRGATGEELSAGSLEVLIEYFLSGAIGRVANPVFFLVSGYLFFWAWRPDWPTLRRKWRRRAFTLLVPLVMWTLIGKGLWTLDHLWTNRRAIATMIREGTWGMGELVRTFAAMNVPSQLWFIQQLLLLMVVVAPLLAILIPRLRWWTLLPLGALYFLQGLDPIFWVLRKVPFCCFGAGAVLGYLAQPLVIRARSVAWTAFAVWLAAAVAYTMLAVFTRTPLSGPFKLLLVTGVIGIWAAYDLLPESARRVLAIGAAYRFFIYMGFDPALPILQKHFLGVFGASEGARLATYFFFPCVVVALCIGVACALNRFAPGLYYLITGGRTPSSLPEPSAPQPAGLPAR